MNELKKHKAAIIISAIILIAAIVAVAVIPSALRRAEISNQFEIAQQYLNDLDYESALLAFTRILEIDPKNVEARKALQDTYLAYIRSEWENGNIDHAKELMAEMREKLGLTEEPYTVTGIIVDSETGDPIEHADINLVFTAIDDGERTTVYSTSMEDGTYSFHFIEDGFCSIEYSHPQYSTVTIENVAITVNSTTLGTFEMVPTDIIDSGVCGDNIAWTLYEDYTLIVSGTGDMWDYHYESDKLSPWGSYRNKITSIIIKDGITGIGEFAFYYCENVDGTITVPDSVTAIEKCAFEGCRKVDTYNLPHTLKTLAGFVFKENNDLSYIHIPSGVTEIGEQTFHACHNLSSIVLPEGLKRIGYWAFGDCFNLMSIEFPESLEIIADAAFWHASLTGTVNIPSKVFSIGSGAFYGERIDTFVVDSANNHYKSVDGVLYNYAMTELIQYPRGKQGDIFVISNNITKIGAWGLAQNILKTVVLPETVKEIENGAFWGTSLTSLYIPASVEKIGNNVFEHSQALTGVYFYGNVPVSFGNSIIANCSDDLKLYYISGTSGWTTPTWTAPDGTVYATAIFTP